MMMMMMMVVVVVIMQVTFHASGFGESEKPGEGGSRMGYPKRTVSREGGQKEEEEEEAL